eukprot:5157439-Pleurochrysis_carterae.AAC.1
MRCRVRQAGGVRFGARLATAASAPCEGRRGIGTDITPMWCAVLEECTAKHCAVATCGSGLAPTAITRRTKSPAARANGR